MIGRGAIEKYPPIRNRGRGSTDTAKMQYPPTATDFLKDIRPIATDNPTQNRHTSSIQSDREELHNKGYKYLPQVNKTSVFLF